MKGHLTGSRQGLSSHAGTPLPAMGVVYRFPAQCFWLFPQGAPCSRCRRATGGRRGLLPAPGRQNAATRPCVEPPTPRLHQSCVNAPQCSAQDELFPTVSSLLLLLLLVNISTQQHLGAASSPALFRAIKSSPRHSEFFMEKKLHVTDPFPCSRNSFLQGWMCAGNSPWNLGAGVARGAPAPIDPPLPQHPDSKFLRGASSRRDYAGAFL